MTDSQARSPFIKTLVIPFAILFAVMFAFAMAREFGWLDLDVGKRGAAAMMGLLLAVCGNILPKIARRMELGRDVAAAYARADRWAGWTLVLTGIIYAGIWAFAPIDRAAMGASLLGLGGFLFALGVWLFNARPTPNYSVPTLLLSTAVAGRASVFLVLASLFLAGALFPIDAIWGDAVAQRIAIVYSVALPAFAVALAIWAKLRAGKEI